MTSASTYEMPPCSIALKCEIDAADALNCRDAVLDRLIKSAHAAGEYSVRSWLAGIRWHRTGIKPGRGADQDAAAGWAAAEANALLTRACS